MLAGLTAAFEAGGLLLVLVLILCLISWNIINHILKTNNKTLEMAMNAQEKWQKAIDGATNALQEFRGEVKSAHGYQREEHNKIVENQTKISEHLVILNENAQDRGKSLRKICDNLDEQGKVLARINGYQSGH